MLKVLIVAMAALVAAPLAAQDVPPLGQAEGAGESGGSTLEDILRRQNAQSDGDAPTGSVTAGPDDPSRVAEETSIGSAADADLWSTLRHDEADVIASNGGPAARTLIQDGGMRWLQLRAGPIPTWGGIALLATLALLAAFLLLRGRIRIDGARTGIRVPRFKALERFGHWLLAGSFVLLAVTGLISLFGRKFLIPVFGHEAYAGLAAVTAFVHDNVSWAFMLALVMIFVMWVVQNIPNRHDLKWLAMGGGIFSKRHAPARKFNAGQKLIFWAVIVLGISISLSGLSLLFPFELPMFAKTFGIMNDTGVPQILGFGPLPVDLAPHEEMQYAQLWHSIVAFGFIAIVFAHIYLGSVGMEGAFDAMGRGDVELQWAREHHNLWVEELRETGKAPPRATRGSGADATPAE